MINFLFICYIYIYAYNIIIYKIIKQQYIIINNIIRMYSHDIWRILEKNICDPGLQNQ